MELIQKSDVMWQLPESNEMQVPAYVFLSKDMLELAQRDRSLDQLRNVTTLPGIVGHALVMPDVHEGYGFPIGGVAALDVESGVISPGGIGYDINCGVRLLKTDSDYTEIKPYIRKLANELNRQIPSGVGKGGGIKLNDIELSKVLNNGVFWAVENGYADRIDIESIESGGKMVSANAEKVSSKAKSRGRDQLGTMGAGNHFVEINRVETIFDKTLGNAYGLREGQIVILIHTGSRGLGHQVATDYIRLMMGAVKSFGYDLPDRELVCAPINSPIGEDYFEAMSAAANYAWTNRQLITHHARNAWANVFGQSSENLGIVYDVAHNIAKIEKHTINGVNKKVIVHRKGATRALPSGHEELSPKYRPHGQPVLIPGSMGTSSYVLAGAEESMNISFGSACHGAGRTMSRTKARKKIFGKDLLKSLNSQGIEVQANSLKGLAEEAPDAYKDVDSVVSVVEKAGIAKIVAKLRPLAVVKG